MKKWISLLITILVVGFVIVSCTNNDSVPPKEIKFIKTFGDANSYDWGHSVKQTTDGGYIIAGRTVASGTPFMNICLIKTTSEGIVAWSRTLGDSISIDNCYSVQQTLDGGYILVGSSDPLDADREDVLLIKTDMQGIVVWSKTFGGIGYQDGFSVQQTTDKGFIITGSDSGGLLLIKTDQNGDELWYRNYGGTESAKGKEVQQTFDGGFIIIGYTSSYGAGETDIYLLKTDSEGNEEWYKTFGDTSYDFGWSVQQTTDNGYILTGQIKFPDTNYTNLCLIKTDNYGNEEWIRYFGGTEFAIGYSVKQTDDTGYIITGHISSLAPTGDVWLLKTDSYGNEEWNMSFGGSGYDCGYSVQQTNDYGYILTGIFAPDSTNANLYDVLLIKTDSEGNFE